MSILNDEQLLQAHEQLGRLQTALAALKRDLADKKEFGFRLLAEGPLEDIRALREAIADYTGETLLEVVEVDFRFRLAGLTVKWRDTPISVIAAYFNALRTGVKTLAAVIQREAAGYLAGIDLRRASDLALVDLKRGSLDVGLRLPETQPVQLDAFSAQKSSPVRIAVNDFLNCATWIASDLSISELESKFPDVKRRRATLRAIRPFVPRHRGAVETVSLYGPIMPVRGDVTLKRNSLDRIAEAYQTAISEKEISLVGEIREIDLDSRTFELRNVDQIKKVSCQFSEDIAGTAQSLLGRRVHVVGSRTEEVDGTPKGKLMITEILPEEPET